MQGQPAAGSERGPGGPGSPGWWLRKASSGTGGQGSGPRELRVGSACHAEWSRQECRAHTRPRGVSSPASRFWLVCGGRSTWEAPCPCPEPATLRPCTCERGPAGRVSVAGGTETGASTAHRSGVTAVHCHATKASYQPPQIVSRSPGLAQPHCSLRGPAAGEQVRPLSTPARYPHPVPSRLCLPPPPTPAQLTIMLLSPPNQRVTAVNHSCAEEPSRACPRRRSTYAMLPLARFTFRRKSAARCQR